MTSVNGSAHEGPLLEVTGLSTEVGTALGTARVVDDVSFRLAPRTTLGIVGESGSGKTMTALSLLGMVNPPTGRVVSGSLRLAGREIDIGDSRALREIRGKEIAMIFQEPRRSIDPAFTVGDQISEVVRRHLGLSRKAARARAVEMLSLVRIPKPAKRVDDYPHAFSGGMCQRVMIAMALACEPKVLIADEPTTALDVTVQAHVLDVLHELQDSMGLGILFITHDLGIVAEMCQRVLVMYAGQVVEEADVLDLFTDPQHPYTAGLLRSMPQVLEVGARMDPIPGLVPHPTKWPSGCRFHPRCEHATDACIGTPVALEDRHGQGVRCVRAHEVTLAGIE
jgi:oligopeptide/dipeptide ABC transporter ATP-binding protein